MKRSLLILSIFIYFLINNFTYALGNVHKVVGEGFGEGATGGRGGELYTVSNLNDNGIGSLRQVIQNSKRPAIIKFENCGSIELEKRLVIERGELTIDGSDCKSGSGIQIKNYPVTLRKVKNVILSNIAFRLGTDAPMSKGQFSSSDPLEIECSQDIVLDHLSVYWGTDENISIYCSKKSKGSPSTRISIQYTIIAEALRSPKVLAPEEHSMGVLITGTVNDITFYGNLFVSNSDRNPAIYPEGFSSTDTGVTRVQFVNNMMYQTIYGLRVGRKRSPNWSQKIDVIGNYQKDASDNYLSGVNEKALFTYRTDNVQEITAYISDNIGITRPDITKPENNIFQYGRHKFGAESINGAIKSHKFKLSQTPLTDISNISIMPAESLESFILLNAGKILPCRDPVDKKVIDNVKNDRLLSQGGQGPIDEPKNHMSKEWACVDTVAN